MLVGGLGFVAGLVLSGAAPTMELFVVGRLAQGLGCGLALTAMYVVVADAFPKDLHARVFSLFATAWVLPSIGGAFACTEMFLPLVLQRDSGLTPTLSGLVLMVAALGWTAGSAWSGRHGRLETYPALLRGGTLFLALAALVVVGRVTSRGAEPAR